MVLTTWTKNSFLIGWWWQTVSDFEVMDWNWKFKVVGKVKLKYGYTFNKISKFSVHLTKQPTMTLPLACTEGLQAIIISYKATKPGFSFYRMQWTVEGSVFGAVSLWFFVCVWNISGNCWTDVHQTHTEDVVGPLLGRVWRSRSLGTKKRHFSAFLVDCVQFMLGKTSLSSSLFIMFISCYSKFRFIC